MASFTARLGLFLGATLLEAPLTSAGESSSNWNVAIRKTATQSSVQAGGVASRAVDGNTNGEFENWSVSHTQKDSMSWWEVDLGMVHELMSVRVVGRNRHHDRDVGMRVLVSLNQGGVGGTEIGKVMRDMKQSVTQLDVTYYVPKDVYAVRYVRVQNVNQYITLAEVEAFGHPQKQ